MSIWKIARLAFREQPERNASLRKYAETLGPDNWQEARAAALACNQNDLSYHNSLYSELRLLADQPPADSFPCYTFAARAAASAVASAAAGDEDGVACAVSAVVGCSANLSTEASKQRAILAEMDRLTPQPVYSPWRA